MSLDVEMAYTRLQIAQQKHKRENPDAFIPDLDVCFMYPEAGFTIPGTLKTDTVAQTKYFNDLVDKAIKQMEENKND